MLRNLPTLPRGVVRSPLGTLLFAVLALGCSSADVPQGSATEAEASKVSTAQLAEPEVSGFELLHYFGCVTCHEVPGSALGEWTGPPLADTGDKLQADWLRSWLRDPKALRPATLMPRMPLEQEALEVLELFLHAQRRPQPPVAVEADASRGAELFDDYDCLACHHRGGEGELDEVPLDRTEERLHGPWLVAFLQRPDDFLPGTDMPDYEFTVEQAADVAAYLLGDSPSSPPTVLAEVPAGGLDAFVGKGCAGCHRLGKENARELATGIGKAGVEFHRSPSAAGFTLPLREVQVEAMARALLDMESAAEDVSPALWEVAIPLEDSAKQ